MQGAETIYTGLLTSFFPDKNYGFISDEVSRTNIFVHGSKLRGEVKVNERVTYERSNTPRGVAAINIQIIK